MDILNSNRARNLGQSNLSQFILFFSQGKPSPRKELLHNIDPLTPLLGQRLYNDTFDTRVRSAIRKGNWKLLTGDVGELHK